MKKLLCRIFGHKWKYNFVSTPSKVICARCKCKALFDPHHLEWNTTNTFIGEERSDDELIKKWMA